MAIFISDHEKLHETVARSALAAGAVSVVGMFVPGPIATALMAGAVGLAVAVPRTAMASMWALWWACAAGAAQVFPAPLSSLLSSLAIGVGMVRGLEDVSTGTRIVAGTLGAVGAATGFLITRAFAITEVLHALPNGLEALTSGVAFGLAVGVSSVGRHLRREAEAPLELELAGLSNETEIGQLLGRAAQAYRDTLHAVGSEAPLALSAASDMVIKMTKFGKRWREVELEAARTKPDDLRAQLEKLQLRMTASDDPTVRAEFERAHQAVSTQLAYLDEIGRGRERAVARLTHQVATLERLRLAAVHHRSADAARLGTELQPVIDELTDAGQEMDLAAEALTETTLATLPAPR